MGAGDDSISQSRDWLLLKEWTAAGLANATASAILNPIDVTKTRLQAYQAQNARPPNVRDIIRTIYSETGALGLWLPGLSASVIREMLYSGARAGFYVPVRNSLQSVFNERSDDQSFFPKLLSALITGTGCREYSHHLFNAQG